MVAGRYEIQVHLFFFFLFSFPNVRLAFCNDQSRKGPVQLAMYTPADSGLEPGGKVLEVLVCKLEKRRSGVDI